MAVREIVTVPNPVLKRKAKRVVEFGPELQTLIDDMVETMRDAPGVGLAAPQVAVPLRVIVVEYPEDDEDEDSPARLITMVNPEIVRADQETIIGTEGCLSIPGFAGSVDRLTSITVQGQSRRGQPLRVKAKGWLARIFQHEIDHLDGILFTDRSEKVWELSAEEAEDLPLD